VVKETESLSSKYSADLDFDSTGSSRIDLRRGAMVEAQHPAEALRGYIDEEIAAQGADPHREAAQLRIHLTQIDQKADVLLESLSPETKGFIDTKLRELATEKRRLTRRGGWRSWMRPPTRRSTPTRFS